MPKQIICSEVSTSSCCQVILTPVNHSPRSQDLATSAIYGFATQLAFLPDAKLGAIAVTTVDVANTVTDRVTDYALRLMLAARAGEPLPEVRTTEAVDR